MEWAKSVEKDNMAVDIIYLYEYKLNESSSYNLLLLL
jgi:hypothetical protein